LSVSEGIQKEQFQNELTVKAIPASPFSESFLLALVWDMAWEISNVAVGF
jgi:hypothetical protein